MSEASEREGERGEEREAEQAVRIERGTNSQRL